MFLSRRAACILAAVPLALLDPRSAPAGQPCKTVVGHFEASVVPPGPDCAAPLCTAGRVWGGIQGTYRFAADKFVPAGEPEIPSVTFFTGHSTVLLKDGRTMLGTDTGAIDPPPGLGGFASLITFTAGTAGTGQIRLRGDFDAAAGTTSGDYLGMICDGQ